MDLEERFKEIKIENIILIIYYVLISFCLYANNVEKNYFLTGNNNSKELYRKLNISIFTVAIIIYLYFTYDGYKALKNLNINDSLKKKNLTNLSFIGSFLILISGFIFLYIAYTDEEIETEIAFT